jgi:hypothetical protein
VLLLFEAIARIALTKIIGSRPQFLEKTPFRQHLSPYYRVCAHSISNLNSMVLSPLALIIGGMNPQRRERRNYSRADRCFLQVTYLQRSPRRWNLQRVLI